MSSGSVYSDIMEVTVILSNVRAIGIGKKPLDCLRINRLIYGQSELCLDTCKSEER